MVDENIILSIFIMPQRLLYQSKNKLLLLVICYCILQPGIAYCLTSRSGTVLHFDYQILLLILIFFLKYWDASISLCQKNGVYGENSKFLVCVEWDCHWDGSLWLKIRLSFQDGSYLSIRSLQLLYSFSLIGTENILLISVVSRIN